MTERPPANWWFSMMVMFLGGVLAVSGQDLAEIQRSGVMRHGGVRYANFVTGLGDGLDIELVREFAHSLGVRYDFQVLDWNLLFEALGGQQIRVQKGRAEIGGPVRVRIDLAACGITVLPWRRTVAEFSDPVYRTQVWLVARADAPVQPIRPTGRLTNDIAAVMGKLREATVLCKSGTCLDPDLYDLGRVGATATLFGGSLNELAPAILQRDPKRRPAAMTLLDVPDTLVALEKWPGQIKVIGPLSEVQDMSVAFRKSSPKLREAFNRFLAQSRTNGLYARLVKKYYPFVSDVFPAFMPPPRSAGATASGVGAGP